jgi:hypothetical protein
MEEWTGDIRDGTGIEEHDEDKREEKRGERELGGE